jgi:hypothetical protein
MTRLLPWAASARTRALPPAPPSALVDNPRAALCALLGAVGACTPGEAPASNQLQYPALPQRAHVAELAFSAAPDVRALELNCSASELADNGLDDDCDGSIDGLPPTTLSLAYPVDAPGELRLVLSAEPSVDAGASNATGTPSSARGSTANIHRLSLAGLPQGRYRVEVARGGAETTSAATSADPSSAREVSAVFALTSLGGSRTYLVRLGAEPSRSLGNLDVR